MTPAVEVHGAAEPVSKPGLPSNCAAEQPPVVPIVQVKLVEPDALVVSVAVTVTLKVPLALGVPEIRPEEELMDSPVGSPVALQVNVWPDAESVACICRLTEIGRAHV